MKQKRTIIILAASTFILIGIIVILIITTEPMPARLITEYSLSALWHEGEVMNECAECHDLVDFHTCETCHDDHGAVELANIPFFEVVELTGDVPKPAYVQINQILPDQDNRGTHISIFEFLSLYDVDTFESITFTSGDGRLTTIESRFLDDTSMLVPYVDGVRFITESVHLSTWLKGIDRIIIIGEEKPITIDGNATSIGRLLLGDSVKVITEGSTVMLTGDTGTTSNAFVANLIEGARLLPLLNNQSPNAVVVRNTSGEVYHFDGEEIANAVIALDRGVVTLVLPDRGRSVWPINIESIESN
jgi:hypothetical protein